MRTPSRTTIVVSFFFFFSSVVVVVATVPVDVVIMPRPHGRVVVVAIVVVDCCFASRALATQAVELALAFPLGAAVQQPVLVRELALSFCQRLGWRGGGG